MIDNAKNRIAFAGIMTGLAKNFRETVTEQDIEFFFRALLPHALEDIGRAALKIVRGRKYTSMPTLAEFLEYLEGRLEDVAELEARKVLSAVRKPGCLRNVVFDNPITQAVIVQTWGGWPELCAISREDKTEWFIRDFVRYWLAFERQEQVHFGALPGLYGGKDTMMIGDQTKALAVLEAGRDTMLGPAQEVRALVASVAKKMDKVM